MNDFTRPDRSTANPNRDAFIRRSNAERELRKINNDGQPITEAEWQQFLCRHSHPDGPTEAELHDLIRVPITPGALNNPAPYPVAWPEPVIPAKPSPGTASPASGASKAQQEQALTADAVPVTQPEPDMSVVEPIQSVFTPTSHTVCPPIEIEVEIAEVEIAEASDLRIEWNGGRLHAYWRWPEDTFLARLVWRNDRYPQHAWDSIQSVEVTRAEFDRIGRLPLKLQDSAAYYFSVFVGVNSPQGSHYSEAKGSGARTLFHYAPPVRVRYEIRRGNPFFSRHREIVFTAEADCCIGGVRIVAAPDGPPLREEQGETIGGHEALEIYCDGTRIDLPPAPRGYYVKVFYLAHEDYVKHPLSHPNRNQMREP